MPSVSVRAGAVTAGVSAFRGLFSAVSTPMSAISDLGTSYRMFQDLPDISTSPLGGKCSKCSHIFLSSLDAFLLQFAEGSILFVKCSVLLGMFFAPLSFCRCPHNFRKLAAWVFGCDLPFLTRYLSNSSS